MQKIPIGFKNGDGITDELYVICNADKIANRNKNIKKKLSIHQ
jgi:hypothetical protein